MYGGRADLTTYGKVIGGGLPVGAVGGREDIMAMLDPTAGKARVESGGTFSANPLTMTAGLAALRKLDRAAVERLNAMGKRMRNEFDAAFAEAGESAQLAGEGSLFRIMLTRDRIRDYRSSMRTAQPAARMAELHGRLLREGVIVSRIGLGCLSTPMGEAEIDTIVAALKRALVP